MNRAGLIECVREALGGSATKMAATLALDAVLRSIQEGLAEDGEVRLAGFGQFQMKQCAAKTVCHPKTGVLCPVEARSRVHFKASPQQIFNCKP